MGPAGQGGMTSPPSDRGGAGGTRRPAPPADQHTYLAFLASGLALALCGGFVLSLLIPLASLLHWHVNREALAQAHGWTQLDGWLGLVAAGMALRLLPRFAHRAPLPAKPTVVLLCLLVAGGVLRLTGQLASGPASVLLLPGAALGAAGLAGVSAALLWTLARSRGRRESWRSAAWAAAAWWATWAALALLGGVRAAGNGGLIPPELDEASVWAVLLGAIGNLVWAVQARSVPVFYGRDVPRRLEVPLIASNLGVAMVLGAAAGGGTALRAAGFGLAGAGILWLAPLAGSVHGRPHRLRPPSRPAGRFIVTANRWAMVAGACLCLGAALAAWGGTPMLEHFEDAALHALGLGLATTLIVGMARLVAPVFAIARAEPGAEPKALYLTWLALLVATTLRVAAALLPEALPVTWSDALLALAGSMAWVGLALFAASLGQAWARQAARRDALVRSARQR